MSSMDIDLPLEDVIKKSRAQKKSGPKKSPALQKRVQQKNNGPSLGPKKTGKINKSFTTKGPGRVGAPGGQKPKNVVRNPLLNRTGITTAALRAQAIKKPTPPKLDPSSIIITKTVTPKLNTKAEKPRLNRSPPAAQKPVGGGGNQIRGISGNSGFSIRGGSGPTTILIRNLDPGANAEDVRAAFMSFGEVLDCELAVDRSGRSLGEAEVQFASRDSALKAVQQLDGELADGRVLRLSLRDNNAKSERSLFGQSVRSMVSSSVRPESRLYSDNINTTRSSVFDRR
ncbi:hypothetical protein INT43_008531 [Umbelopsis isabellina]|uniref:RRM domain-containing protein n=1 Tax=Mortierella isabellina TaxID=91625 RepID=A0A8H7UCW1_MORIS|nr:hypothetical protein INT43_008531 [Umbelopsis isabellina]